MPVVVLARMKDGKIEDWKRLDEVWALVGDKPAFTKYVRGKSSECSRRPEAGGRDSADAGANDSHSERRECPCQRNARDSDSVRVTLFFNHITRRPSYETCCHRDGCPWCCDALYGRCFASAFRRRIGRKADGFRQGQGQRACRSRRRDVLPSHPTMSDLPPNGKLLGGGRRERLCQANQELARSSSTTLTSRTRKTRQLTKGYKVGGPTLIVAQVVGNKVKEYKNLTDIWAKNRDKDEFLKYVRDNVAAYQK